MQPIFERIANTLTSSDKSLPSRPVMDPRSHQVDNMTDTKFFNYVAALLSTVSCSQTDIVPHLDDEEVHLTNSAKLMTDKSHPVGTVVQSKRMCSNFYF